MHNIRTPNNSDFYQGKILALKATHFIIGQLGQFPPYCEMQPAFEQTDLHPTTCKFIDEA